MKFSPHPTVFFVSIIDSLRWSDRMACGSYTGWLTYLMVMSKRITWYLSLFQISLSHNTPIHNQGLCPFGNKWLLHEGLPLFPEGRPPPFSSRTGKGRGGQTPGKRGGLPKQERGAPVGACTDVTNRETLLSLYFLVSFSLYLWLGYSTPPHQIM